jgi:hypothetical protein
MPNHLQSLFSSVSSRSSKPSIPNPLTSSASNAPSQGDNFMASVFGGQNSSSISPFHSSNYSSQLELDQNRRLSFQGGAFTRQTSVDNMNEFMDGYSDVTRKRKNQEDEQKVHSILIRLTFLGLAAFNRAGEIIGFYKLEKNSLEFTALEFVELQFPEDLRASLKNAYSQEVRKHQDESLVVSLDHFGGLDELKRAGVRRYEFQLSKGSIFH